MNDDDFTGECRGFSSQRRFPRSLDVTVPITWHHINQAIPDRSHSEVLVVLGNGVLTVAEYLHQTREWVVFGNDRVYPRFWALVPKPEA
jgi:hypothetical protein